MPQPRSIAAIAIFVVLIAGGIIAAAGEQRVVHDDVTYALDARYHELPQALVDRLKTNVPRPPYGRRSKWCFGPKYSPDKATGFCVCYTEQGCKELKASALCDAKLGAIDANTAVCRSRAETVVVG